MHNYLFFPLKYQNWRININDLERKTYEIKFFYQFFHPKYVLRQQDIFDTQHLTLKYWLLKPHEYVYVRDNDYNMIFPDGTTITVPVGSIVVSNARNEGQGISSSNSLNNFLLASTPVQLTRDYYFIQPLSMGFLYQWGSSLNLIQSRYSTPDSQSRLQVLFNFNTMNIRWYCERHTSLPAFLLDYRVIYGGNVNNNTWTKMLNWNPRFDNLPFVDIKYGNDELILDTSFTIQNNGFQIQHISTESEEWPNWELSYRLY